MYRPALLSVLICTLSVVLVTGQTCTDSCRVVCDSEPAGSNGKVVRRGKQGAKGEKGDVGARGEKGADNSNLVGGLESRVSDLENFNEFLLKTVNDKLKSNI